MRARGFTLLEMLTTLAIASVLLSLSVVGVTQMQKASQQGNATQQVLSLLNRGRQRALSVGAPVRFFSIAPTATRAGQVAYERLGCDLTLAGTCPRSGCSPDVAGTVCSGTCANVDGICAEMSERVTLPVGMTVTFLTGATAHQDLCLVAGTAQPSSDCATAAPSGRIVLTGPTSTKPRVLFVEGLTGMPRATDCQVSPTSPDCP